MPSHRCKREEGEEERKDPDQAKRTMKIKTEYKLQVSQKKAPHQQGKWMGDNSQQNCK